MAVRQQKGRPSVAGPGRAPKRVAGRQFLKTVKPWKKYPYPITIYAVGVKEQADIIDQLEKSLRYDRQMMTSAVNAVGEKLSENFATSGRSQGKNWAPLARPTYTFRGRMGYPPNAPPLVRSGALETAINEHLVKYQGSNAFGKTYTARIRPSGSSFSKKAILATKDTPGGGGHVSVTISTRANRMNGKSQSTMSISGEAVKNNSGGRVGRTVIPRREFWFISPDIKKHSIFMVQGVLNQYFKTAGSGLKSSAPTKRQVASAARRAFSMPATTSRQALATINREIFEARKAAGIKNVNIERIQRARREREAQNFYWILSQSDNPDLGLASKILRHLSGIPMTQRYRRVEIKETGQVMPSRDYIEYRGMVGSISGKGGRKGKEHIVRVGSKPEHIVSMETYLHARAIARKEASEIRKKEIRIAELRALKTPTNREEVDRAIAGLREEIAQIRRGEIKFRSGRTRAITPERAEKIAIRYYVRLAREVEETRKGVVEREMAKFRGEDVSMWKVRPYKRWQRRAVASYEPVSAEQRLRTLLTGTFQPTKLSEAETYAQRQLARLRTPGAEWQFGSTLGEQLMLMRAEIESIRGRYPGMDVERTPFRYAENTPEGRQERYLASIAPAGLVITGGSLKEKGRFERTRSYGGSRESINIRRHSIATNLIESGTRNGQPVLIRAAQELLSHTTDTLVRDRYGVHSFRGEGDIGTTARIAIPDWTWTDEELARNRIMQLHTSVQIVTYLMNRAWEQSHYTAMYNLAAHMIGLYQPETKNRAGFSGIDNVRAVIEAFEYHRDIELSALAGRPVVGPRFFSRRREMSMAPNYEDPLMVNLGLSNRPNAPLPNERFIEDPATGRRRAVTRDHIDWFDPSSGIIGVDPETAIRSGLMDDADFSPDIRTFAGLNEMWMRTAEERFGKEAVDTIDAIKKEDASSIWRDVFTPPSARTGEPVQNWWQYRVYGTRPGQAYEGSGLQSPFGQVFGSRVAQKMRQQSIMTTAETIAELERERPELFDVLSTYDKWRIIGIKETMAWVRQQEDMQSDKAQFFSSARKRFKTRKEIARERMQK